MMMENTMREPDGRDSDERKPSPKDERNYGLEHKRYVVEILTVALLAVYTGIAGYQAWKMRQATIASTKAADAATSAAQTAKDALDFTRQTEEPFIALESLDPNDFPGGRNPGFILRFRNYGRRPAFGVAGNATMTIGSINAKLPKLDPGGNFRLEVIPGGATATRWMAVADERLFGQHRQEIKLGTTRFYVRGFISWEDINGKKSLGKSFCLLYNANPARPPNVGIFDYCQQQD